LTQAKKTLVPGLTEAEAIERAKAGDAASFEALYALHKRRVYSLCLRMVGNTAEAEDLAQEAFLQLGHEARCSWSSIAPPDSNMAGSNL